MRRLLLLLIAGACDTAVDPGPTAPPFESPPPRDLEELYGGDQGIYRGCGPNGGVCHNGKEFPNFASLGSILENIDQPCNQARTVPTEMHDLCERPGDRLRLGDRLVELGHLEPEPAEGTPLVWRARVAEDVSGMTTSYASVVRSEGGSEVTFFPLTDYGVYVAIEDPRTVVLILPDGDLGALYAFLFATAGVPGDPASIALGDPNQNGVYGATLGGSLIEPGAPERSYLIARLTDPAAGPLMPRANCCYWTKETLRGAWCWIAGLAPDGANALAPIDYEHCPPGPVENVRYPTPGPACETSGLCPVAPGEEIPHEPTWANLYENVFAKRCTGGVCHSDAHPLSFASEAQAWNDVQSRLVPGDPAASPLFVRLDPTLCIAPACVTMPLGMATLEPELLDLVREWIASGATRQ